MADPNRPGSTEELEAERAQRHESHASGTYKRFLRSVASMGGMEEVDAERAAVSVLSAIEQRLFGEEARHLEAQLPSRLRDLLHQAGGEPSAGKPKRKPSRTQLFESIARELGRQPGEVEPIVRSVFAAVRAQITEGEAEDVAAQLPRDLADLWRRPI